MKLFNMSVTFVMAEPMAHSVVIFVVFFFFLVSVTQSVCVLYANLIFIVCADRPQATVREVLPPRKSLRLQNKEADMLTLPPEPRGALIYEKVPCIKLMIHV